VSVAGEIKLNRIAFVTVGWYWSPIDAWMLRNRLADEGIDAFVIDEFAASTYWLYANAIRGIKVQVPSNQLPMVQQVLARGKSNIFAQGSDVPADADQPTCSNCGSSELYRERFSVRFVFLFWIVFGVPIPVPSSATECFDCGARHGSPTSFRLQYGLRHLLLVMFIVAFILGIMRITGHTWFESASAPLDSLW